LPDETLISKKAYIQIEKKEMMKLKNIERSFMTLKDEPIILIRVHHTNGRGNTVRSIDDNRHQGGT